MRHKYTVLQVVGCELEEILGILEHVVIESFSPYQYTEVTINYFLVAEEVLICFYVTPTP